MDEPLDPEQQARHDAAFDALSNWYENALGAGAGFKSEEERQAYIKSLGDPMNHPMFATTTEELEGHPLTEAFRCIREEDKNLVELAEMYKEEGNEWIKKGNKKSFEEAYQRYSHALTFVDRAVVERKQGLTAAEGFMDVNLEKMKSQIIGNRAQSSLLLLNYGSCRRDCDIAIRLWPENLKCHFRRCKALHMLKYYKECLEACEEALKLDATNKDIQSIQTKCSEEHTKRRNDKIVAHKRLTDVLNGLWSSVWELARKEGASLGHYPISHLEPQQLRDTYPHNNAEGNYGNWPILVLYPQYSNFDIIQAAPSVDMLVDHMAVLFPEKGDYEQRIEWDLHEEYQASNVVVYLPLEGAQRTATKQEWMDSARDHHVVLKGDPSVLPLVEDAHGNLGSPLTSVEEIKAAAVVREKAFDDQLAQKRTKSYLELHLGCTIGQILKVPQHVVAGGVISLIVFPKNNAAHKAFLKEGHKISTLNPVVNK